MAQIQETIVMVKLSKLVRSDEKTQSLSPEGFAASLEAVAGELVEDKSIIVEVIEADSDD